MSFHFLKNKLKFHNNSIYTVALHPCQYACEQPIPSNVNHFNDNRDNCLGQFYFHDSHSHEVMTEASHNISLTNNITIIPEVSTDLPIECKDDLRQNVTSITVYFAEVQNYDNYQDDALDCEIHLDPVSNVITNNQIILHGQPGKKGIITLTLLGNQGSQVHINFNQSHCPPGYVVHKGSCRCSATMDSTTGTMVYWDVMTQQWLHLLHQVFGWGTLETKKV